MGFRKSINAEQVFSEYLRDDSIDELARRHRRSVSTVRRIVAEMRAKRLAELPLAYIPNEQFEDERAEKAILAPTPRSEVSARKVRRPAGLPSYLASLYEVPLLSRRQEEHLFRKMNYLKHKAAKLLADLDPARPGARLMTRIEGLYEESVAVKNTIIRANLRLVVSVAKRYMSATQSLYEVISDGNLDLVHVIEGFDFARGYKFSTYGTVGIGRRMFKSMSRASQYKQRYQQLEGGLDVVNERATAIQDMEVQEDRERQVKDALGRLSARERRAIDCRFGLSPGQNPLGLKEVGSLLGVSKERARQIQVEAIRKMQAAKSRG